MKFARRGVILTSLGTVVALACSHWWGQSRPPDERLDDMAFFCDLIWELNEARDMAAMPDLLEDVQLQLWVQDVLSEVSSISELKTEEILEKLKKDIPSVATAAIFVVYSDNTQALQATLLEWSLEADAAHTHIAARLFSNPEDMGVGSLAMMVGRLPKFQPKFLGKVSQGFYNICPICNESHHGKVNPIARSIVLECPKCEQRYDLLAADLRGQYHRVTSFLNGAARSEEIRPMPDDEDARREVLFSIWEKVLNHCRYVKDFTGINGRRDAWQFADETDRYRNGDCEDTAILLADWLISRGFDARVALGRTDQFEGHAWCVVHLDGIEYILETTEAKPDRTQPPTSKRLGHQYVPEFLLDRENIYFREGSNWDGVYWSENNWVRVSYPEEADTTVAVLPSGN